MEHKDRNHNHGNGFLLGLIIGGVATVLFTTKKGREIVKEITEKGFEKIADLQEGIEETVGLEDGGKGDYLAPVDRSVPLEDDKVKLAKVETTEKSSSEKVKTPHPPKAQRAVKRFFRKNN